MKFVVLSSLTLIILFLVLLVFLRGKTGMFTAALLIGTISLIKGLSLIVPGSLALLTVLALIFEGKIQRWVHNKSQGSLFYGLAGSLILLLVYGIFLGPFGSLLAWLISAGFQLLPQLRTKVSNAAYFGNSLYRVGLSFGTFVLGLYTIYKQ